MATNCNSLNVQTIKVSQLAKHSNIDADDFFLSIESGSNGLFSRRTTFGDLSSYIASSGAGLTGSFSGSANGIFTGSFTGSLRGNLIGRANFADFSTNSSTASYIQGYPSGTGNANYFTYWTNSDTVAGDTTTNFSRNTTLVTPTGPSGGTTSTQTGRLIIDKPLQFPNSPHTENLTFYSASAAGTVYGLGMQYGTIYTRTGATYAIYYSGSYINNDNVGGFAKSNTVNAGNGGYTTFVSTQRLVGIGHFDRCANVKAQLHIHISGSDGYGYAGGANTLSGPGSYDPNINAFLITSGSSNTTLLRVSGSGQLDVKGDIIAYSTFASSDERLKNNIAPIENATDKLMELNPSQFEWTNQTGLDFGLIAQDVEKLYPNFVKEDMNGNKSVKYNSFIGLLIKALQEQNAKIEDLSNQIKSIQDKL